MTETTVKAQEILADAYLSETRTILRENFLADNRPWVVPYSGGKDSTLVLQLVYEIAGYEGFYASIIYSCFFVLGLQVIAEDVTNQGRIDLTVFLGGNVYIIEFKVLNEKNEKGRALAQIKAKNYPQKYAGSDKNVFLIGID